MTDPRTALVVHFWGKHIGNSADTIADEALKALDEAGYVVVLKTDLERALPLKAVMADETDEAWLREHYGKGSEELADEAEAGYDVSKMTPCQRAEQAHWIDSATGMPPRSTPYDVNPVAWPDSDPELREATERIYPPVPPGSSVLNLDTGEVTHTPGRWADNFGPKDGAAAGETVHCYGCGEEVPYDVAHRNGDPNPFHWNEQGGGHTVKADAYGPHVVTYEPTGKQALCGGPGFCKVCDETPERVPTVCPHCSSVLVTKNWPKGSDKFYQWCEKCRCTVAFVSDDEEDDSDAADESTQMYTTHKAQDEENEPRYHRSVDRLARNDSDPISAVTDFGEVGKSTEPIRRYWEQEGDQP